ncbi:MAG: DUF423 domain-containing protein [Flavobacteriales bacterium]|nr:DUF423 domain-containing protein [Flavobacteriales bacterium]
MTTDKYLKFAIFFSLTAVILGAMGAHALKDSLSSEKLISFQTGIRYQMFHGIALLILVLNSEKFNYKLKRSLNLMIAGIFCFSFSIYFLSIQETLGIWLGFLGPITPIGGLLLISSWANLFFTIKKND